MAVIDFPCIADAIVASPNLGAGQDKHNVCGDEGTRTLWSFLKFDNNGKDQNGNTVQFSSIAASDISSAKLFITRAPSGQHDSPNNGAAIRVAAVGYAWQEGNKGGGATEIYSQDNAIDFANMPEYLAAGEIMSVGSQPSAAETQWSPTITSVVKAMRNAGINHGIVVRAHNDVADICFWARHHATASKRPFLRVETSGGGGGGSNHKPSAPTVVVQM